LDSQVEIGGTTYALLAFVDVIDSSKYSSVLGYEVYAKSLLNFQNVFERLGKKYFPDPRDQASEYRRVVARGDEGALFFVTISPDFSELIFRAIEFIYHLKGYLRFGVDEIAGGLAGPRPMGLGAGIHVGKVAYAVKSENNRSIIDRLEGYSINFAKRVESCSRLGKYSCIFLSKEAAQLIEDKPVVLSRVRTPMKGIDENVEVYEVLAGLFSGIKLNPEEDPGDERLQAEACRIAANPQRIGEAWHKSLILSILDCLIAQSPVSRHKIVYRGHQLSLAWQSAIEDDPILLYMRAVELWEKGQYTQHIRYLTQILQCHPEFVHARKRMIKACWQIAKSKAEPADKIYARDMAREFLERFPQLLTSSEKRDYRRLVKGTKAK
jgi:hypothetical protein